MHFEIAFRIMMLIFVVRMNSKLPRPTIHPAQNPTCPIAVHRRDPTSMRQRARERYHCQDRFLSNHPTSTTDRQTHRLPARRFFMAHNRPMPPPPPARLFSPSHIVYVNIATTHRLYTVHTVHLNSLSESRPFSPTVIVSPPPLPNTKSIACLSLRSSATSRAAVILAPSPRKDTPPEEHVVKRRKDALHRRSTMYVHHGHTAFLG